ncbi:nucleoside monophosphate kinase [Candidatus Gottesmanbacteria bacterium]|nr:nucleoside monophosphate kinase [Candidatus Gottesmanbacteria bacterium]
MHIVIYGPEGSGKGTQAKLLSQKLSVPVYTSGDLVREAATHDTGPLGRVCKEALTEGKYVPDNEMFLLWERKLHTGQAKKGFILDGFPRNRSQAEFLFKEIKKSGYNLDRVIYLSISDKEAILRLSKRKRKLFAGSTINHDERERVKKRLEAYRGKEASLLKFFQEKKLLTQINAKGTVEEVFQKILTSLGFSK